MIFLGLFFGALQAQLVEEKECFTPPLLRNFDLAAYSGMWWSLASYPARYHTENSRCTRLFYDLVEENDRLYVNNTSIRPDDSGVYYLGWTQGYGYQQSPRRAPNLLYVDFRDVYDPDVLLRPNYWVLETDYEEYVYGSNCNIVNETHTSRSFWFLGREKEFVNSDKFQDLLEKATKDWGLKQDFLIYRENDDCTFDYLQGNE